jgi:hypothetical protein
MIHQSDSETFIVDDQGFMTARCSCGWSFGPVPGPDEVVDVLMEHAYEIGLTRDLTWKDGPAT